MNDARGKLQKFYQEHESTIKKVAAGAVIVGATLIAGAYYNAGFRRGFMQGGMTGFGATIEWLDDEFPEKGVGAAVEAWRKANPDKWVTVNV